MATVTGFTAERMKEIEDTTVVDGEVQGDNLVLLTRDGTPIDAGSVRGPKGDTGSVGPGVVHAGIISMYAGEAAPPGYLLCDGTPVSRTTYPDLFTAISTFWGAGDGSTTFNLPDLRNRFPVAKGPAGWSDVLAEGGGSKDAPIVQHQHDIGHTHNTLNHQHGFDHDHVATAGYESGDHTHTTAPHVHEGTPANPGGVGYAYRNPVAAGNGDGYDIANGDPNRLVNLYWADRTPTNPSAALGSGGQIGTATGNRNTHGHAITVQGTSGKITTPTGAQALVHTGKDSFPEASVPVTNMNLPPYVVVNFIIKT